MKKVIASMLMLAFFSSVNAQNTYTREQVLSMTEDQLMDLSMEDFAAAIKAAGVSNPDELFAMIMNKNVSSASKSDESTFDSPLSTSVITHDEIRRFGCMSMEEAFKLIPGVIVYQKTNGVFDVVLRGLTNVPENNFMFNTENCNTLIMIDGRQVFNYSTGATFWESLPVGIDDVDRIEVVRGPASALYGSNAVTGVINIITFKGNVAQKSVVGNVSYGSQSTASADVSLRKSLMDDKLFIGMSANMQNRERNTDQFYVAANDGLFMVNDYAAILREYGIDMQTKTYDNQEVGLQRTQIPLPMLNEMKQKGYLESIGEGRYVERNDLANLKYVTLNSLVSRLSPVPIYSAYSGLSDFVTPEGLYHDPNLSRKNIGTNVFVHFMPNENVDMSLTGGYQNSTGLSSTYRDDYYYLSTREMKSGYANLSGNIYGLNLQASYWAGSQNYCVGFPGYKLGHKQFTGQIDYDFRLLKDVENQSLSIRPGVSVVYYEVSDEDYKHYTDKGEYLPGYLNGTADLKTQSASLRFDYRLHGLRVIAAYRAEKLNVPDEWRHTWQFGSTYSLNDRNSVRFVYGRANRSSFVTNSSSNYTFNRSGMSTPDYMTFLKNEDADVVQLDNIEVGFRSRPTSRILIDLEAFYSWSKDFGGLISYQSQYELPLEKVRALLLSSKLDGTATEDSQMQQFSMIYSLLKTRSYMRYQNDPCKPKQMGVSLGVDWIATDKLIFKMNANIQRTVLDDYQEYSQTLAVERQLTGSVVKAGLLQQDIASGAVQGSGDMLHYLTDALFDPAIYNEDGSVNVEKSVYRTEPSEIAKRYGMSLSPDGEFVCFGMTGTEADPNWITKKHQKSQATPAFYGALGFVYKPIEKLSISADCDFMTKREYRFKNSQVYDIYKYDESGNIVDFEKRYTNKVDNRFVVNAKLGYQPVKGFEVYVNARNLFNNEKQEFINGDKIGGIYSVGASFEF